MSLATESANLGLWLWDIARDEIWVTPRFRSMFGFGTDERITFAVFRERLHPDDRETMERHVRAAVDDRQPYELQYRLALPEGGERWIAAAGRVEYTASGAASRMQGVCRDITEWRQAQQETERLQHEIAHVDRISMMGQLASALAHELNQPLGAILRTLRLRSFSCRAKRRTSKRSGLSWPTFAPTISERAISLSNARLAQAPRPRYPDACDLYELLKNQ